MTGESLRRTWRVIARALRLSYDYAGLLIAISALWFALSFVPVSFTAATLCGDSSVGYLGPLASASSAPWLFFGVPVLWVTAVLACQPFPPAVLVSAGATLLLAFPATLAAYDLVGRVVRREEVAVRDYFGAIVRWFVPGLKLGAVGLGLGLVLASDVAFTLLNRQAWVRLLAGLWLWILVFWGMMSAFAAPFMVRQGIGVGLALKRAALVALDNPVVALGTSLAMAAVALLSLVLQAPLLLLFLGMEAFIAHVALDEVLFRYEKAPADPPGSPGQGD